MENNEHRKIEVIVNGVVLCNCILEEGQSFSVYLPKEGGREGRILNEPVN
jgi:hypothetical protein